MISITHYIVIKVLLHLDQMVVLRTMFFTRPSDGLFDVEKL